MTVVRTPADLTADWLAATLGTGAIASFSTERIGTGQMSESHRVTIEYADGAGAGPATVVVKVAAADETSRQTGVDLGLYEREVRFYAEVAPHIGGPLAPCYHASYDVEGGTFCLLLGDAGPAVQGDEIAGTDLEHAELCVRELARLHAPALGSATLESAEWLNRDSPIDQALLNTLLAGFLDRYENRIAPEHRDVCERFAKSFDGFLDQEVSGGFVLGLIHGDYRLDNLLFGTHGAERPLTVVDWQTVGWGAATTDLAYFLGCALTTEDRRTHEDDLVRLYHESLGPDAPITLDQCREGVRHQSFYGVMMAIVSPLLVVQTERGDEMFMTMLDRHATHVLDLDALAVLPEPATAAPLRPEPSDEHQHEPGDEKLWNESWYFDVADEAQGVGAYVRLGLGPNEGHGWYTAFVCGPGRPTVAVLDFEAPLPGPDLAVATGDYTAGQLCEAPLDRYRVTLAGRGEAHDDPAAILRGERGTPVDVALDLVWHTAGVPYQYRLATRYEIPCRVTGTLTVDRETFELREAPGQRDHSWGVRDWWSMGWVWSAVHLDDGTRLHGLDLRLPEAPRIGIGYMQPPDGELVELEAVNAEEEMNSDGLPSSTKLTLSPTGIELTAEPLGHGPLRLEADDGRVALFPRAWCRVTTADGRTGVGWLEWNLG